MESGVQPGNDNAKKGAEWRQAIKRALAHESGKTYREGLDICATEFVKAAKAGDPWAMKELGDRVDGKSPQSVNLTGDVELGVHYMMEFPENGDNSSEDPT